MHDWGRLKPVFRTGFQTAFSTNRLGTICVPSSKNVPMPKLTLAVPTAVKPAAESTAVLSSCSALPIGTRKPMPNILLIKRPICGFLKTKQANSIFRWKIPAEQFCLFPNSRFTPMHATAADRPSQMPRLPHRPTNSTVWLPTCCAPTGCTSKQDASKPICR